MTVFPYPELDAEKEAQYELFPINLTRMMLHTQGLTVPYWKYALGFRNAKITPKVREQVIVRVGAVADCKYQLVQHRSEALRTGISQELLADLINPPSPPTPGESRCCPTRSTSGSRCTWSASPTPA